MKEHYFRFKRFCIVQEKSAMKVGIDSVMLGSWADVSDSSQILDVGTGTGLLALMMAQRSDDSIDAVEIEPDAACEATLNFKSSPWNDRLRLVCTDFLLYEPSCRYSHIISNPPFFDSSFLSNSPRTVARQTHSLDMIRFLSKAVTLLAEHGKISLVLPAVKEELLRFLAFDHKLFISRLCRVAPDTQKNHHRILVELSTVDVPTSYDELFIRDAVSGEYSEQYKELTSDFYINSL